MAKAHFKKSGDLLKCIREHNNVTQKQLSDGLGYMSAQFVSNWERGLSHPPAKTVKKVFNVIEKVGGKRTKYIAQKYILILHSEMIDKYKMELNNFIKETGL